MRNKQTTTKNSNNMTPEIKKQIANEICKNVETVGQVELKVLEGAEPLVSEIKVSFLSGVPIYAVTSPGDSFASADGGLYDNAEDAYNRAWTALRMFLAEIEMKLMEYRNSSEWRNIKEQDLVAIKERVKQLQEK
jgi:hypothetical protein